MHACERYALFTANFVAVQNNYDHELAIKGQEIAFVQAVELSSGVLHNRNPTCTCWEHQHPKHLKNVPIQV